jgi:hypothetical protein
VMEKERGIPFSASLIPQILRGEKRKKLYCKADPSNPEHLRRRLLNGIEVNRETGCWEWRRAINSRGRGTLTVARRTVTAARLAYSLFIRELGHREFACHKCDNPLCINPSHLFPGSQLDNMRDCSRKGRIRTPIVSFKGEANPACRLSAEDVTEVRNMLSGGIKQRVIALRFRISQSQVSNIKRGVAWA